MDKKNTFSRGGVSQDTREGYIILFFNFKVIDVHKQQV